MLLLHWHSSRSLDGRFLYLLWQCWRRLLLLSRCDSTGQLLMVRWLLLLLLLLIHELLWRSESDSTRILWEHRGRHLLLSHGTVLRISSHGTADTIVRMLLWLLLTTAVYDLLLLFRWQARPHLIHARVGQAGATRSLGRQGRLRDGNGLRLGALSQDVRHIGARRAVDGHGRSLAVNFNFVAFGKEGVESEHQATIALEEIAHATDDAGRIDLLRLERLHDVEKLIVDVRSVSKLDFDLVQVQERVLHSEFAHAACGWRLNDCGSSSR